MQPVADVFTRSINRERLPLNCVQGHQRNQFFRELAGTVIIRAIRNHSRQTIRFMKSTDKMITRRLGSGVRAVGRELGFFRKGRIRHGKRPEHFVCRNVMEAESALLFRLKAVPPVFHAAKQDAGAHHIGADKGVRINNGPVNVALRGEVHHRVRLIFRKNLPQQLFVTDIAVDKHVVRIALDILQIHQVAGIGELIEINNFVARGNSLKNETGTNKTGSSGYQQCLHACSTNNCYRMVQILRIPKSRYSDLEP